MKKYFLVAGLMFMVIILGGAALFAFYYRSALTQRQEMIHSKGENVMPFDLSKTTHIFKKTENGGVEEVIAKNVKDTQQISLIQMHLQMEAELFQKGDFQDPAKLHGINMPGLEKLSAEARQMKITYSNLPNGGQITYATDDVSLVSSIHEWFDAQLSDHGNDATGM